jgi:hypothetical protein
VPRVEIRADDEWAARQHRCRRAHLHISHPRSPEDP